MCIQGEMYMNISHWNMVNITSGMYLLLREATKVCCSTPVSFAIWRYAAHPRDLEEKFNEATEQMVFPVVRTRLMHHISAFQDNYQFLEIMDSPGAAMLVPPAAPDPAPFLAMLTSMWQALFIMVLSCLAAGVTMWAFDTWHNPDEFPRTFLQGLGQGMWWAFISMTTVGYGDKIPRSPMGRFLAGAWILYGTFLTSVFTAALFSAFNNNSRQQADFFGQKVGVLNGTQDQIAAVTMGAVVREFADVNSLLQAIHDGHVKMGLLDFLYLIPNRPLVAKYGIRQGRRLNTPLVHGALINQHFFDASTTACLQRQLSRKRHKAYKTFHFLNNFEGGGSQVDGAYEVYRLLNAEALWLWGAVGAVCGLVLVLAVLDKLLGGGEQHTHSEVRHSTTEGSEAPQSLAETRELPRSIAEDTEGHL